MGVGDVGDCRVIGGVEGEVGVVGMYIDGQHFEPILTHRIYMFFVLLIIMG